MICKGLWFFGLASVRASFLLKALDFHPFPPSFSVIFFLPHCVFLSLSLWLPIFFTLNVLLLMFSFTRRYSLFLYIFFSLRSGHEPTLGTWEQWKTPPAIKPFKNWPKPRQRKSLRVGFVPRGKQRNLQHHVNRSMDAQHARLPPKLQCQQTSTRSKYSFQNGSSPVIFMTGSIFSANKSRSNLKILATLQSIMRNQVPLFSLLGPKVCL